MVNGERENREQGRGIEDRGTRSEKGERETGNEKRKTASSVKTTKEKWATRKYERAT